MSKFKPHYLVLIEGSGNLWFMASHSKDFGSAEWGPSSEHALPCTKEHVEYAASKVAREPDDTLKVIDNAELAILSVMHS